MIGTLVLVILIWKEDIGNKVERNWKWGDQLKGYYVINKVMLDNLYVFSEQGTAQAK